MIVTVEVTEEEAQHCLSFLECTPQEALNVRCDGCHHLDAFHDYDRDCSVGWCNLDGCECERNY